MPSYYFDASALVKRYLHEHGSAWVQTIVEAEHPSIFISLLSGAEVTAAITRKARAGEITLHERDLALEAFRADFTMGYIPLNASRTVIDKAMALLMEYPLRGFDAVQLATAIMLPPAPAGSPLSPLIFVSADRTLNRIASLAGLPAEDPGQYG